MDIRRRSTGEIASIIFALEEQINIIRKQKGDGDTFAHFLEQRLKALKWVLFSETVDNILD